MLVYRQPEYVSDPPRSESRQLLRRPSDQFLLRHVFCSSNSTWPASEVAVIGWALRSVSAGPAAGAGASCIVIVALMRSSSGAYRSIRSPVCADGP